MAFVASAITGTIDLDASPQVEAVKTAVAGAREYRIETEKAAAAAAASMKNSAAASTNSFKDMLKDVKGEFGKSSIIGQSVKLLAGGGAIMGISMAANQFKDFTAQLLQMKEAINSNTGDWESLTEKVASSIPVFGSFFEAGLNIREMFTGEKAAMKEVEEESKKYDDALLFHKQILGEIRDANIKHADTIRDLAQAYSLIGKSGISRELQEIQNHTDNLSKAAWDKAGFGALKPEQIQLWKDSQKKLQDLGAKPQMESLETLQKKTGYQKEDPRSGAAYNAFDAQQENLKKWMTAHNLLVGTVSELKKTIANADRNAVSEDLTGRIVGLAEKADVFKNKWVGAFDEYAIAGKRRIDEMNRVVNDHMADMRLQLNQLGMTDSQKKVDDFRRLNGSSDAMVAEYKKGQDKIDAYDKNKKANSDFDDKVKGMVDSIKTPMQKFSEEKFQWMKALASGKINTAQFNVGVAEAYQQSTGTKEYKRPELIMAGSAEAAAAKFDGADKKADPVPGLLKDSNQLSKEAKKTLDDILKKLPNFIASNVWELSVQ